MGYVIYAYCMFGIGWGSFHKMAQIYPLIGITMYSILMLMITDTQQERGRLITSIVSGVIFTTALLVVLFMPK